MCTRLFYMLLLLGINISLFAQQPVLRDLGSFSELIAGDKIMVRLVKAEKESAAIQVQGIDASAVRTEITGNVLEISIYGEPFTKKKAMVTLHYVHLNAITVTGGADVTTKSLLKTDQLKVDLKSGGMLYLDADIELLTGKLTEGSLLTAEGYATRLDMVVSSTATLSAFDLESEMVKIKAVSGGKAKINVEKELDAEANSKGFISYKGNPAKINRLVASGGSVKPLKP